MDPAPPSEWHSIRPWTPHLALSVREITSVSATFILSSTLSDTPLELGLNTSDDEDDDDEDDSDDINESSDGKRQAIVSDALAKGLSVNVNGSPWQRVLVDDKADEAVIIIFGLMPGRQYDIDLGLVQGGHNNNIRRQVITEDSRADSDQNHDHNRSGTSDSISSTSSSSTAVNGSTSEKSTPPSHNSPNGAPITLEDRLQQLQHTLSLMNSERDALTASLKSARRDSQKADAALRSEIEVLKRSSEKHSAAEHRARQKVLALQEAVKRAQTATKEIEELVREVEDALPQVREKRNEKECVYASVKSDSDRARQEREKEGEKNRKRVDSLKGELTGLGNRLEKLNGKKDKLEGGVIPDLEEQLREIEKEIERVEADPYGYTAPSEAGEAGGIEPDASEASFDQPPDDGAMYPYVSYPGTYSIQQRHRSPTQPTGTISRLPPPLPIQRPVGTASQHHRAPGRHSIRDRSSFPAHAPSQGRTHHLTKSQGQVRVQNSSNPNSNSSSSASPTPSPSAAATSSTLSSRAQPFEPSRGVAQAVRASHPASGSVANAGYGVPPAHRHVQLPPSPPQTIGGNVKWARAMGSQSSHEGSWSGHGSSER